MNRVVKSSFLLAIAKFAEKGFGLISTLVLARLLTPEAFGLVAIAMLTLWLVETLTESGTESYILQKEAVSDSDINTAWTLDIILKLIAFFVLVISAPLAAAFYDNSELVSVIPVVALLLLCNAFKNPGLLILKRQQKYEKIVFITLIAKVFAIILTISLAFLLKNHWAIIIGHVLSSLLRTVLTYFIANFKPSVSFENIKIQWDFSKWLIPQAISGYLRNHLDALIVSTKFDASSLGGYNVTKYVASMPALQLINPLTSPLHAEYGKVRSVISELSYQFNFTIKVLTLICAPMLGVISTSSEEIVLLLLGEQWVVYHNVFLVISFSLLSYVVMQQAVRLLMLMEKTRILFFTDVLFSLFLIALLLMLSVSSIEEFAKLKVIAEIFLSVGIYMVLCKCYFKFFPVYSMIILLSTNMVFVLLGRFAFDFFDLSAFGGVAVIAVSLAIQGMILLFVALPIFWLLILSDREKVLLKRIFKIK